MKKIMIILSLLAIVMMAPGQSQRLVLAEEFTNASCPPCAQQNPAFDALLEANSDIVTSIKYHTSWPGTDPMYSHNTVHNTTRTNYYGVASIGVPYALIDSEPQPGSYYTGAPANVTQQFLDEAAAVTSPFEIQLQHEISADEEYIHLSMIIEATGDVSGNLRAHMAVIEKHIHYNNPPGSNGETDFYNVMKYMIPSANGTALPNFVDGDYLILQGSWELDNVYEIDELAAVAFVQDNIDKQVHQAANNSEEALTPLFSYDAQATSVSGMAHANCSGMLEPVVTIRNNGSETLTSLDFNYSVNEGVVHTHSWNGSLDFLETASVTLPEYSFELMEENILAVETVNPSGEQDEYTKNDSIFFGFEKAVVAPAYISLTMRLDSKPEETSWEVLNSSGEVIHEGGDYTAPNQFIQQELNFDVEDCYTFYVYDSGGDGFEQGSFINVHVDSEIILQETSFGAEAYNNFKSSSGLNTEESVSKQLEIYPNPASTKVFINALTGSGAQYKLMDLSGRMIQSGHLDNPINGHFSIDVSSVENGIYIFNLVDNGQESSRKISILR